MTALCGQTPSECYVAWGWLAGNGGWPAQSVALSDLCLGPTRTLALCFGFPLGTLPKPALSIKAVKAERSSLDSVREGREFQATLAEDVNLVYDLYFPLSYNPEYLFLNYFFSHWARFSFTHNLFSPFHL